MMTSHFLSLFLLILLSLLASSANASKNAVIRIRVKYVEGGKKHDLQGAEVKCWDEDSPDKDDQMTGVKYTNSHGRAVLYYKKKKKSTWWSPTRGWDPYDPSDSGNGSNPDIYCRIKKESNDFVIYPLHTKTKSNQNQDKTADFGTVLVYPNRVKRGDDGKMNGCGGAVLPQYLRDAANAITGMKDACNIHDLCYHSCIETHKSCDDEFKAITHSICEDKMDNLDTKKPCKNMANAMYKLVRSYVGKKAFEASRNYGKPSRMSSSVNKKARKSTIRPKNAPKADSPSYSQCKQGDTDFPCPQPSKSPRPAPPAPDVPSPEDRSSKRAFSKGDPHFKTFGGELYDFHGECDLVLLHNPDFQRGLGMDIHIRTKIEAFWSSIEVAAIQIGDDVMEIKADPKSGEWLFFSGEEVTTGLKDGEWNHHQLGGFLVRYKSNFGSKGKTREANVYLVGAKEILTFKTFNNFVRIDVNHEGSDNYSNAVGLLGSQAHEGKRLGRDGKFIEDVNAFGQEWQVIPALDGSLFHSYEGAVVGKKCVMPPEYDTGVSALKGRRLGASSVDESAAEKACGHVADSEEKNACIFDVVATQDLSMASTW